ncbi:MAG: DNA/RNA helicase [Brasilonema angustatum HA4187-MV1]|nr:DNA/RNA helicase [Brasilonema angustatum HA4187-MV1]
MNKASKVEPILNAWLKFIALEDYSQAKISADKVKQRDVNLKGNRVFIEQDTFSELQKEVNKGQSSQETLWALSFPQIRTQEEEKSYFRPLFTLDITSILQGAYQAEGWNIDELKLTEAGENLATFIKLDDEEREQLNIQNGLRHLLNNIFGLDFEETYENWIKSVSIPRSSENQEIKPQPYLFEFQGSQFYWNLRSDLKDILKNYKDNQRYWFRQKHPAYEYLFGKPELPKYKITYMGAFPTNSPADSQLKALKHAQTETITAVQGPPGSGKTTLILHVIAQQAVKRAIHLIETGEDINNLTVVSSTVNKAVTNVIEKLDDYLKDKPLNEKFLYLKGGSKANIDSPGGAKEQLQSAILDYLEKNNFDENIYNDLAEEIKRIKSDLTFHENNYLNLCRQRASDEAQQPQLQAKIQKLELELESANAAIIQSERRARQLELYAQFPIDIYQKIKIIFDNAILQLPRVNLPWWRKLWLWVTRTTETHIVTRTASRCQEYILQTRDTPFPVENPTSRSILVQQAGFIEGRLDKARELQGVQVQLKENSDNIIRFGNERDETLRNLTALEGRLETQPKDFYSSFHEDYHEEHKKLFELSRQFLNQHALRNKKDVKQALTSYSNFFSGNNQTPNTFAKNSDDYLRVLSLIFPVITCTLQSVRNMLPSVKECIDRTIVDEAGMIPLHQTFPLLVRSRNAIIVGDPLQIEPIISLASQRREQYCKTAFLDCGLSETDYHCYSPEQIECATTYHRAAGASGEEGDTGEGIRLIEHYRCQPSIIQYCDRIVGYGLEVKTKPTSSPLETNLIAYHVEGNIKGKVNQQELTAVHELIKHLVNQGYSPEDIGVISPFRVHADALKNSLLKQFPAMRKDDKDSNIGTIHNFQGSQKKVIILSTKVCQPLDNYNWINKRPNLLNVAVSRAEELFILVGNLYRLEKAGGYTRRLVEHIREHGVILEYKTEAEIPEQQAGSQPVYDCNHLKLFQDAIEQAEQELTIVTPWIRGNEPKRFVNEIVSCDLKQKMRF